MAGNVMSPCVHDWVFWHAARTPAAPAIATPSMRLTYADLAARIRVLAGRLAADGIGPGDRVLVALPNVPATVVASLAVQLLGGAAVEVNREWGPETLADIATRSGVRAAFVWARDTAGWGPVVDRTAIRRLWVVAPGPGAADRAGFGGALTTILGQDGVVEPGSGSAALDRYPVPDPDPDRRASCCTHRAAPGAPTGSCRRSATWTRTRARSSSTSV